VPTIVIQYGMRCDSRCYSAKTEVSECHCICEGMNHGRGFLAAMENAPRLRRKLRAKLDEQLGQYTIPMEEDDETSSV
jgi:hypothetical protein